MIPENFWQEKIRQTQQIKQSQPFALNIDLLELSNLHPWCRVCRKPVDRWRYDRYEGGFFGFTVHCHNCIMGGLIPHLAPFYGCVLEVFCFDAPHSKEGYWYWIGCDGVRMQESPRYVKITMVPGIFTSGFGKWAREYGMFTIISVSMAVSSIFAIARYYR